MATIATEIANLRIAEAAADASSAAVQRVAMALVMLYPGKNIILDFGLPAGHTLVVPLPQIGAPGLRTGAPSARLMRSNEYRQLGLSLDIAKYVLERDTPKP